MKVSSLSVCLFTRQFVCMMDAGLPLLRALDFYAEADPSRMGQIVSAVADHVRSGGSLSKGLSLYPNAFSRLYVGLVRSGEGTGELDKMLNKMANVLERQTELQKKMKAALTYPICLISVAFLVFLAFIFCILPALEPMLVSVNVAAPWPTQVLVQLGWILRNPILMGATGILLFSAYFAGPSLWKKFREDKKRCVIVDRIPLEIPGLGVLLRRILLSRVLFALSTTVDSGLSITNSLHLSRQVASNAYIDAELLKVHDGIGDGLSLSTAMEQTTLFFPGAIQMVHVGEETSSLSSSLHFVAQLYEEIAESAIEGFAALVEPLLMAGMGFVAGFLILGTILPIVRMLQAL